MPTMSTDCTLRTWRGCRLQPQGRDSSPTLHSADERKQVTTEVM
jgi:hypothetical protein